MLPQVITPAPRQSTFTASNQTPELQSEVLPKLITLSFSDGRTSINVSNDKAFIDASGERLSVRDRLARGNTEMLLRDGSGQEVVVQIEPVREAYSSSPGFGGNGSDAPTFERADIPNEDGDRWTTYNFEVAEHHTYIADGVRVHNDSDGLYDPQVNESGHVVSYRNEQGQTVTVSESGNYSEAALQHYGREVVHYNEDGTYSHTTGHLGLGGAIATFFDRIGLDGQFGVQGTLSSSNQGTKDNEPGNAKPVIIDLDGDGVEVNVDANVSFDFDNDGFLEQGAWAAADDGFLVIDLNADGTRGSGDGVIDQALELAFCRAGCTSSQSLPSLPSFEVFR